MTGCITKAMVNEYEQCKDGEKERLELVFKEFGPLQYWEEIHFIQEQILKKYNIKGN